MRLGIFLVVFAIGALASAFTIDDLTVCPALAEGEGYEIRITAWPPFALQCEGRTYIPGWEWLCVAASALGVASFRLSVPRVLASIGLILLGLGGWFLGGP